MAPKPKDEPIDLFPHTHDDCKDEDIIRLLQLGKIEVPISQQLNHSSTIVYNSITKLDLFQSNLSQLPSSLHTVLPNLSILFCMKNQFKSMPSIIGRCSKLQMVSFKSNQIQTIDPAALAPQLKWLILTDNELETIPSTIGRCGRLQKLMLSGNKLKSLPKEIGQCQRLELVRLASNKLDKVSGAYWNLGSFKYIYQILTS